MKLGQLWKYEFEKLEQPLILAKNSSYKFSTPGRMIYFTTLHSVLQKKKISPRNCSRKFKPSKNRRGYLARITRIKKKKNNRLGRIRKRGQRDVRGNDNAFSLSFPRPIAGLFVTRLLTMVKRKQKVFCDLFSLLMVIGVWLRRAS